MELLNLYLGRVRNKENMDNNTALAIRELSDKLGATGSHLWGVLLKQAKIEVIAESLFLVVSTIALSCLSVWCKKKIEEDKRRGEVEMPFHQIGLYVSLLMIAVFIMFIGFDIVSISVNPEFWALKQLVGGHS